MHIRCCTQQIISLITLCTTLIICVNIRRIDQKYTKMISDRDDTQLFKYISMYILYTHTPVHWFFVICQKPDSNWFKDEIILFLSSSTKPIKIFAQRRIKFFPSRNLTPKTYLFYYMFNENYKYTYTILIPRTNYTVQKTHYKVNGFQCETVKNTTSVDAFNFPGFS